MMARGGKSAICSQNALMPHMDIRKKYGYYKYTTTTTNILFPETHILGLYPIYHTYYSYFIPFPVL
jgi:hypothetical protein